MRVDEHPPVPVVRPSKDRLLSIGVFARRARLSTKALRLYDRLGVLTPAEVDRASGYRRYRESQLTTARLVAMLRRLDMPLADVGGVIAALGPDVAEVGMLQPPDPASGDTAGRGAAKGAALLQAYWDSVERRVASQRELAVHLRLRLLGGEGCDTMFDIRERDVADQLVLIEQRHVQVDELSRWIGAAIGRLMQAAPAHGGAAGHPFVIYHGEVNQDSDGPVEACVPVASTQMSNDAAMRREAAHHEAYVRLRKAQVAFPQILSAFDAVHHWAVAHGLSVTGSPREIYFTDFMAAAPTDEVCDVAFPVYGNASAFLGNASAFLTR